MVVCVVLAVKEASGLGRMLATMGPPFSGIRHFAFQ
jgi:hypothetical protein